MEVKLDDALVIGKGDELFSLCFYREGDGADIVPHDSKDDSDRKDPFLAALYDALNMLPGHLVFVRTSAMPPKAMMKRIIKGLWGLDAASYHGDNGFEYVCDELGNPITLAMYASGDMSRLFLYLPRGVKGHDIPSYTDEELRDKLEEVLNAPLY